jgi:hypothetical protein
MKGIAKGFYCRKGENAEESLDLFFFICQNGKRLAREMELEFRFVM